MTTAITALPFMGGELSSFDPSSNSVIEDTSGPSARYILPFARCAIKFPIGTYAPSPTWPAAPEFWFHGDLYTGFPLNGFVGAVVLELLDGATTVLELRALSGIDVVTYGVYTLQGGVMTSVGTFIIPFSPAQTLDFRLVAGAGVAGICEAYVSGTRRFAVTGLNHAFTGVTSITPRGPGNDLNHGSTADWSQIIGDSVPHVRESLYTFPLDSNSAVNLGWTGGVTDVNEVVLNDATFVTAATAGLVSTYFANGFSLAGYDIRAIGVANRAKAQPLAPQNLDVALRSGGSNFFSADIGLNVGYQTCFNSWRLDPATGLAWLPAAAAAVEGGQRSMA